MLIALITAVAVAFFSSVSPLRAVVLIVFVFAGATLYLLASELGFIGFCYLIVYVGAIAILFLFVVMLTDSHRV